MVVVSFMVAVAFSLDWSSFGRARSRRPVRAAGSCGAFPEQGPHVGDVVLGYRNRELAAPCSSLGPLQRKVSTAVCDSQRSKMFTRPGSIRFELIGE